MDWEIEVSDEFIEWYRTLDDDELDSIDTGIEVLEKVGPKLGRPQVDKVQSSKFQNMKELRIQHHGKPYRILFAFDPQRAAYLIIGGDKTGNQRWYDEFVPKADSIYEQHLRELAKE